jgi:hypothetical protein
MSAYALLWLNGLLPGKEVAGAAIESSPETGVVRCEQTRAAE